MLTPADAFWLAASTVPVRSYATRCHLANLLCGSPDRAVSNSGVLAQRRADRTWEEAAPALKRIDGLLEKYGLALSTPRTGTYTAWGTALYESAKSNVSPGSASAAALDLGALAADVAIAAGALADQLGAGPHGEATAPLRAEGERRRASLEAALYCLGESLTEVEPLLGSGALSSAVGEAVAALKAHLAARPEDAGRLASWAGHLPERLRVIGVALSFPPEPATLPPATPEERSALDAVLASPGAEAPRRLYAELAGRRGDPRGAFVLDQLATSAKRRLIKISLDDSELARHLLKRYPEWSEGPRRLGATEVRFFGGFVEEVTIDAGLFLEKADALVRAVPLRGVRLTAAAPRMADIVASPHLARLASLAFPDGGLDDAHVSVLAASPHVRGLLSLDLGGNRVTDAGLRALAASPNLPSLVQCVTRGNPCGRLYESGWSLQEIPTQEWQPTDLLTELTAAYGNRRWFRPYERTLGLDEL